MTCPSLSVVVAVQAAHANLDRVMAALAPERYPDVEVILVYARGETGMPIALPPVDNVRQIEAPAGSLIPHLWHDGIGAAGAERVATLSAACIPSDGWIALARQLDLSRAAGIGGPIVDHPHNRNFDRAVTLQRYAHYGPARPAGMIDDIAADNAVYRRSLILAEADLLARGFFEPAFHARFKAAGLGLAFMPDLWVFHRNRYGLLAFISQRLAHGFAFGHDRAAAAPPGRRLLLVAAGPVLPLLFLHKILRAARARDDLRPGVARAFPWLLIFVLAWGVGEFAGSLGGLLRRRRS